jgi:hypothetical protein
MHCRLYALPQARGQHIPVMVESMLRHEWTLVARLMARVDFLVCAYAYSLYQLLFTLHCTLSSRVSRARDIGPGGLGQLIVCVNTEVSIVS